MSDKFLAILAAAAASISLLSVAGCSKPDQPPLPPEKSIEERLDSENADVRAAAAEEANKKFSRQEKSP
jgi:hypothetical protein